jgi:PAS domain S-box-containing protein
METTKFRSQLIATLGQVRVNLQRTQSALLRLAKSIAEKRWRLQEVLRARENDLRKLLASFRDAIVATNDKIAKFTAQLFAPSGLVRVYLQRIQNALLRPARIIAEKRSRLREALRARENDLRKLLGSSIDAIVLTNSDRRIVAANSKALDLFGISQANMGKFTIDAFVSCGQILNFDGTGPPSLRQEERSGKCKIRRMDGSLRVADYIFAANFVPRRHLCRFRSIKTLGSNLIATISSRPRPTVSNSSHLHPGRNF